MNLLGVSITVAGLLAIMLQVLLAYRDKFLTPRQMIMYHGYGLPLLWHFGILWGDILIAVLCGYLIARYGGQWNSYAVVWVAVVALVLSLVMHFQYLHDPIQNAHMHDGKFTPPAYIHFLFMWMALTIIGLFFLATPRLSTRIVIGVAALLWLHVVLGTHLIVKLWSPPWFLPQPAADAPTLVVWFGSAAALIGLSWWALH